MKTYSRLGRPRLCGEQPPLKRRRVSSSPPPQQHATSSESSIHDSRKTTNLGDTSSSPLSNLKLHATNALISSKFHLKSTPPSSPPLPQRMATPTSRGRIADGTSEQKEARPIFDVGKALCPLSASSLNARKRPIVQRTKLRRFTQMQIDLGQKMRKECKTCGMEYTLSNAEDVELHKKYHNMNVDGIQMGKAFLDSDAVRTRRVWEGSSHSFILECHRKDGGTLKSKVEKVLEVADMELGAVKIPDGVLWSANNDAKGSPRFKAYVFVKGSNCVGLCLVEALESAYLTMAREEAQRSSPGAVEQMQQPLRVSVKEDPMLMGITRVWTSNTHRHRGIATRLLDTASENFLYGVKIAKEAIAFSQPTEHGTALAKKWYGADSGWHVYSDS